MPKTNKQTATSKSSKAKRVAGKSATVGTVAPAAIAEAQQNGALPRKLDEKIEQATLRSFQMAYESHAQPPVADAPTQPKPARKKKAATAKPVFGRMSERSKRLTLEMFQMVYEQYHPSEE